MSFPDAATAIRQRFLAAWSATPVRLQNGDLTLPFDASGNPQPWVYLEVLKADEINIEIGNPPHNTYRTWGLIQVAVYVPVGQGPEIGEGLVEQAGAVFRNQTFSAVTCWEAQPGPEVEQADGNYSRFDLTVRFHTDTTS